MRELPRDPCHSLSFEFITSLDRGNKVSDTLDALAIEQLQHCSDCYDRSIPNIIKMIFKSICISDSTRPVLGQFYVPYYISLPSYLSVR